MTFFLTYLRGFSGREERRFARRFVLVTSAPNCRRSASYLPPWDGTDPAMRGLVATNGGRP